MTHVDDRLFDARVEEFKTVRDEMLISISGQQLVLTFGLATLVGAFAAGLLVFDRPGVSALVFLSVPPVSCWVGAMWLAEVVRMLRAATFVTDQSALLNAMIPGGAGFRWESWRFGDGLSQRTIRWNYYATVGALALIFIAGLACGVWRALDANWSYFVFGGIAVGEVIGGIAFGWFSRSMLMKWDRAAKAAAEATHEAGGNVIRS